MVVHCDLSTQEVKEPPESWFFGRVAETFFIAGIEGSDRSLLLVYDGDADYENLKDQTMEDVLEEINSRRRSYPAGGGFVFPPKLQQSVDEGPASYRQLMICARSCRYYRSSGLCGSGLSGENKSDDRKIQRP